MAFEEKLIRTKQMFMKRMSIKSPLTTLAYDKRIRYFEDWWAKNYPTHEMFTVLKGDDLWDILQLYTGELAETLAPNTVWNYVTSLRKYLHYMGVKECDRDSFQENIEMPEKHEKELYPLKLEQIQILLDKMEYRDKALFICQSACGGRIGEMLQLRKKNFNFDHDRVLIKIPHTIAKFHKARTSVLSKEAGVYLKALLGKLEDDDLVFTKNPNVRSAVTVKEEVLRHALNRCDLGMRYEDTKRYKINTHSFRAYFITKASRSDPNIAKKLAGEKGYLLQYDRLEDFEFVDAYKLFELNLCIYDTAKAKVELELKQTQIDELEEKNKLIVDLQEQVRLLSQDRKSTSIKPDANTEALVMKLLRDNKLL